jgi:hypothetical protein
MVAIMARTSSDLSATRVAEKEARHCGRVRFEHLLESSVAQLVGHRWLERVRETETFLGHRHAKLRLVGHDAAARRNAPALAPALQLPRIEGARRLGAECDALVAQQVLWCAMRSLGAAR